jgi:hypothetical protein
VSYFFLSLFSLPTPRYFGNSFNLLIECFTFSITFFSLSLLIFSFAEALPGVVNRSQVIQKTDIEIGPVENAITNIAEKNEQLVEILHLFTTGSGAGSLDRLTRSLNGVIDAEVNGGVKKYQEAFFREEYVRTQRQQAAFLPLFLAELQKTLPLLEQGLKYHRQHVPEAMMPLQQKMEKFFETMKDRVKSITVPVVLDAEETKKEYLFGGESDEEKDKVCGDDSEQSGVTYADLSVSGDVQQSEAYTL